VDLVVVSVAVLLVALVVVLSNGFDIGGCTVWG
jgi:hypothetical protein